MPLFGPNVTALKQKRDIPALIKILQRDNVRMRREAIRALGDIGDRAAVPALTVILESDQPRGPEQIDAVQALGKIADAGTVAALVQAGAASIAREKAVIEEATAPTDNPYRPGFYINRISAEEYTLRSEIAKALGSIGTMPALNALFDMLAAESSWMQSTAREAIRQVIARTLVRDDAGHPRILIERLSDASPEVRKSAAYFLREFSSDASVKALMDAAKNEKAEFAVREAALGSLGKIAGEDMLDEMDELAQSANRAVARLAAHTALEIRHRRNPSNEQT